MLNSIQITKNIISLLNELYDNKSKATDVIKSIRKREADGLPHILFAGELGSIYITKEIDAHISRLSRDVHKAKKEFSANYKYKEFTALFRQSFGISLGKIDANLTEDEIAKSILKNTIASIDSAVQGDQEREYIFGTSLFPNDEVHSFTIGPVRFEPRLEWLNRKATDGSYTATDCRRIRKRWLGLSTKSRAKPIDNIRENNTISAIGNCPYVCSVRTSIVGFEAAESKALLAARLALTSIALLWENSSRALDGFNLLHDRTAKSLTTLSFSSSGNIVSSGVKISNMPHGPSISAKEWKKELSDNRRYFLLIEQVLRYLLEPESSTDRMKIMNTLLHSLLWFHEGCRENTDLLSIVMFAASMDSLAGGGGDNKICQLIEARIGFSKDKEIFSGGPSVKSTIEQIYRTGRSRTIHGNNEKIGLDWSVTRGNAEWFARYCLVACIDWASENSFSNNPNDFRKS